MKDARSKARKLLDSAQKAHDAMVELVKSNEEMHDHTLSGKMQELGQGLVHLDLKMHLVLVRTLYNSGKIELRMITSTTY